MTMINYYITAGHYTQAPEHLTGWACSMQHLPPEEKTDFIPKIGLIKNACGSGGGVVQIVPPTLRLCC